MRSGGGGTSSVAAPRPPALSVRARTSTACRTEDVFTRRALQDRAARSRAAESPELLTDPVTAERLIQSAYSDPSASAASSPGRTVTLRSESPTAIRFFEPHSGAPGVSLDVIRPGLNRAVALGIAYGPATGVEAVEGVRSEATPAGHYLLANVLSFSHAPLHDRRVNRDNRNANCRYAVTLQRESKHDTKITYCRGGILGLSERPRKHYGHVSRVGHAFRNAAAAEEMLPPFR